MADDADITADRDELEAPMRLAASRRHEGRKATGKCHWCGAPVLSSLRFCDTECAEDQDRADRANRKRY